MKENQFPTIVFMNYSFQLEKFKKKVNNCCLFLKEFLLFFVIYAVNEEFWDFAQLIVQKKQLEDVTLGSGTLQ